MIAFPFLLPKKYRLWIWLVEFFLAFLILSKKLKINNFLTRFFGNKASKQLAKIKEQYINESDLENVPRNKSINYIESVLNDPGDE